MLTQSTTRFMSASKTSSFHALALWKHQLIHDRSHWTHYKRNWIKTANVINYRHHCVDDEWHERFDCEFLFPTNIANTMTRHAIHPARTWNFPPGGINEISADQDFRFWMGFDEHGHLLWYFRRECAISSESVIIRSARAAWPGMVGVRFWANSCAELASELWSDRVDEGRGGFGEGRLYGEREGKMVEAAMSEKICWILKLAMVVIRLQAQ